LKENIIEKNLDFDEILNVETLILNKINWNIFLETPYELIYQLLADISIYFEKEKNYIHDIFNSIIDLISYCFSKTNIYNLYNQYVISVSCFMIALEIYLETDILNEFKNFILNNFYCNKTIIMINDCISDIKNNFENTNLLNNNTHENNENILEKYNNCNFIDNQVNHSNRSTIDIDANTIYVCTNNDNYFYNNNSDNSTIEVDYEMNQKY